MTTHGSLLPSTERNTLLADVHPQGDGGQALLSGESAGRAEVPYHTEAAVENVANRRLFLISCVLQKRNRLFYLY